MQVTKPRNIRTTFILLRGGMGWRSEAEIAESDEFANEKQCQIMSKGRVSPQWHLGRWFPIKGGPRKRIGSMHQTARPGANGLSRIKTRNRKMPHLSCEPPRKVEMQNRWMKVLTQEIRLRFGGQFTEMKLTLSAKSGPWILLHWEAALIPKEKGIRKNYATTSTINFSKVMERLESENKLAKKDGAKVLLYDCECMS